ncbi:MAG: PEP-CTERM sorting domain-containing protein [Terriglobia bacterium]
MRIISKHNLTIAGVLAVGLMAGLSVPALGTTITWTTWSAATTGNPGSATGTIGSVGVTYSGQVTYFYTTYPSWKPTSTYAGGTVGNAPSPDNIIGLTGGAGTGTATITFSEPVIDPVMAIWSLGAGGTPAEFLFTSTEPFAVEAGGPSNEYGGSSITMGGSCPANAVCGSEGNGTIQFSGTYTTLTWTNPLSENWYGFDLGIAGVANSTVPEPSALLLFGSGVLALGWLVRKRMRLESDEA